jgi:antitoxin component of RelBE/YafQ-DinJ toxin-antitoxin module
LLEQSTHILLRIESNTKVSVYESTGILGFSISIRTVRFCYKYVIEYSHIPVDVSILVNHVNLCFNFLLLSILFIIVVHGNNIHDTCIILKAYCTILLKKRKKDGLEKYIKLFSFLCHIIINLFIYFFKKYL